MCFNWRSVRSRRSRSDDLCEGEILVHTIVEFVIKNYNKGYIDGSFLTINDCVGSFLSFYSEISQISSVLY